MAYSLMFSSQADLDFNSNSHVLSELGAADLGFDSKLLLGWELLSEHWAVQPETHRLHVFVVPYKYNGAY
jgi:hypothetical protein